MRIREKDQKACEEFVNVIERLKTTTSSTEKLKTLKNLRHGLTKILFKYTLDTSFVYNITYPQLMKIKYSEEMLANGLAKEGVAEKVIASTVWDSDISLLLFFSNILKSYSFGKLDKMLLRNIIERSSQTVRDTINIVLSKKLGCGVGAELFNRVYPGWIDVFKVARGKPHYTAKKVFDRIFEDGSKHDWYLSRKYDGLRCVIIKQEGVVRALSRKGKRILTTEAVEKEACTALADVDNVVLDGEICCFDEAGNDLFKRVASSFRRKDYQMTDCTYKVLDYLPLSVFYGHDKGELFSRRQQELKELIFNSENEWEYLKHAEQTLVTSKELYQKRLEESRDKGYEGLILRKDDLYKGKQSTDIIKVKEMEDTELVCIGVETGPFMFRENGVETLRETVTSLSFEMPTEKGTVIIRAASGLTLKEREDIFNDGQKAIGRTATIQYFQESEDKNGEPSFRHPVFKGWRDSGE